LLSFEISNSEIVRLSIVTQLESLSPTLSFILVQLNPFASRGFLYIFTRIGLVYLVLNCFIKYRKNCQKILEKFIKNFAREDVIDRKIKLRNVVQNLLIKNYRIRNCSEWNFYIVDIMEINE
jgi:hypothetical protein